MADEKFITIAIHTYDRAVTLRNILESHGIAVRFERLVITGSEIASGVRVKIAERNLPLALKLTESGDSYEAARTEMKMAGESRALLIPVDFSPYSLMACRVGFALAERLGLHPVVLYAYATPYFSGNLAYSDPFDSVTDGGEPSLAAMQADRDIRKESERMMSEFVRKLENSQADGTMPRVKFTTNVNEGIPEEVIREYCRMTPPAAVVMATRGKDKKEEELVGSVTAEVLDSCRVPILAIPENCHLTGFASIKRLVCFCNLDQHDILTIDTLMRLFSFPSLHVTLIPVNAKATAKVSEKTQALCKYFNDNYPTARFDVEILAAKQFTTEFDKLAATIHPDLLIVPNKKQNIFSRLFNPGMAHKLLFERDMPLLALPV